MGGLSRSGAGAGRGWRMDDDECLALGQRRSRSRFLGKIWPLQLPRRNKLIWQWQMNHPLNPPTTATSMPPRLPSHPPASSSCPTIFFLSLLKPSFIQFHLPCSFKARVSLVPFFFFFCFCSLCDAHSLLCLPLLPSLFSVVLCCFRSIWNFFAS